MRKDSIYDSDHLADILIKILLHCFKWLCFAMSVSIIIFTMSLLIMYFLRGNELTSTLMAKVFSMISVYDLNKSLDLISEYGRLKVVVAGCGYGFAISLTYGLLYVLSDKFICIYNSIMADNMFTKENVKIINDALPLTLFVAFVSPIIIFCINASTGIFDFEDMSFDGIIYICIAYVLKRIFDKGYSLERKNQKYSKELAQYKEKENDVKINEIKKETKKKSK